MLFFDETGHTIEVNFKGGVQIDSTAKFTTSDEKVQKKLEESSGFNRDYYLESVREENGEPLNGELKTENGELNTPTAAAVPAAAEEAEAAEGNGNVVEVSDKSEAVEWLKEHYPEKNYTSSKLRGKAFEEACKECGVEFVFA